MKRIILLLLIFIESFELYSQVELILKIDTAGTLESKIRNTGKTLFEVTKLTLVGELNGTDIRLIRYMSGVDERGKITSNYNLSVLDIGKVRIVSGGDYYLWKRVTQGAYYWDKYFLTGNNQIGDFCFENCRNLESVVLPKNLTYLGNYFFFDCSSLKSITLPDSISKIETGTFYACDSLLNIEIHNNIDSIKNEAFAGAGLKSISLPDNVVYVGESAFSGCEELEYISIGAGISKLSKNTFERCSKNLIEVSVSPKNTGFCSLDGVLFNKKKTILLLYPNKNIRDSYDIPESVDSIYFYAFYYNRNLTSIKLSSSLKSIGEYSFARSEKLDSIILPNSVTYLGKRAFEGCKKLSYIKISDALTSIEEKVFYLCNSLKNVDIPNSIISIGESSFMFCENLESIILPNSILTIGSFAFYSCINLRSISFGVNLKSIGGWTFQLCKNLVDIKCKNPIPPTISSYTFSGVNTTICNLYVPFGSKSTYSSSAGWSQFLKIIDTEFITKVEILSNESVKIFISNSVLIIEGIRPNSYVNIYSINGILVNKFEALSNKIDIQLPKGIYIVTIDRKRIKVII
jgi:hypothetical protein